MIQQIDQNILIFLNGLHSQFFDGFFWHATKMTIYIPLYLIILFSFYKQYRSHIWIVLLFMALLILCTDQTCNLLKYTVCRLRPSQDPLVSPFIHIVNNYRGGKYGFPSGHAFNTFAMAVFIFRLSSPLKWWLTLSIFLWASIMSYSRIYLGVHYPGDIAVGIILGVLYGYFIAFLAGKILKKVNYAT